MENKPIGHLQVCLSVVFYGFFSSKTISNQKHSEINISAQSPSREHIEYGPQISPENILDAPWHDQEVI